MSTSLLDNTHSLANIALLDVSFIFIQARTANLRSSFSLANQRPANCCSSNASFAPPTELGIKRSSSNPAASVISLQSVPQQSASSLQTARFVTSARSLEASALRCARRDCLSCLAVTPDSLGNWRSYRLSTPATALSKETFSSNQATSSNGRTVASQLTQPPQHPLQPTSLPTGARRATSPVKHLSDQRSFSGPTKLFRRSGLSLK